MCIFLLDLNSLFEFYESKANLFGSHREVYQIVFVYKFLQHSLFVLIFFGRCGGALQMRNVNYDDDHHHPYYCDALYILVRLLFLIIPSLLFRMVIIMNEGVTERQAHRDRDRGKKLSPFCAPSTTLPQGIHAEAWPPSTCFIRSFCGPTKVSYPKAHSQRSHHHHLLSSSLPPSGVPLPRTVQLQANEIS